MKWILNIFFLLQSFSAFSQFNDWPRLEYNLGDFKISAPDSLMHRSQEITVPLGLVSYNTYFLQDTTDYVIYQVQFFDYPEGSVHADSTELVELLFNENIAAATESLQGELLYETVINDRGNPGRLFKILIQEGQAAIKTKMFLIGRRYYAISVAGFGAKRLNPGVDHFMDSFYYTGSDN